MSEPQEFAVEVYRGLRTSVQFLGLDRKLRVIQVTSSLPGEGKTTTATNLAVVLAQAGHQVAIVDADLRKPRLARGLRRSDAARPDRDAGLVRGSRRLVVNHLGRLHVMSAGTMPPNPSEMLASGRFARSSPTSRPATST